VTAYARPDYIDLVARIQTDLNAVPAVLCEPLAAAWARACHSQHGYLAWIDAQCSPLTCELERLYDWAALYGVDRLMATGALGYVLATGVAGTSLLAGTLLRGPNGLDYRVMSAVVLGAGKTSVSVRCETVGEAGNLIAGQLLTLIDPVPGCSNSLTVDAAGLGGGAEDELRDDWRARVADEWLVAITRGARSGKPDDYRFWAKSAHPSISGALVQPHVLGIGTVLVRPICNGLADRLPTQAVLDAVSAYFYGIVPATADWRVAAPIKRAVTVSLHLLPGFDTAGNRTAIFTAVNAAVLAEMAETSFLTVAEIDAAIATVTSQYARLGPLADTAVAAGEVLVLNPIVWS
jgi:uncharacterized phage protein gp47/JayE